MNILVPDPMSTQYFIGANAKKWCSSHYGDNTPEVLPGVFADKRFAQALVKVTEALHGIYLRHEGPEYGQLNTDFGVLTNLAGHPMNPLGAPVAQPRERSLTNDELAIVLKIADILTERRIFGLPLSIARMSHCGVPYMTPSLEVKASIVQQWLHRYDAIVDCYQREGTAESEGVFLNYTIGRRMQYENNTLTFSRSGQLIGTGLKDRRVARNDGTFQIASKVLGVGFSPLIGRMRTREVWGMSGTFNYMWQVVVAGYREAYLQDYAFTLHHASVKDAVESLPQGGVIGSTDFTNFDGSIDAVFQFAWANALLTRGVDPRLCAMRKDAAVAPAFFQSVELGQTGVYCAYFDDKHNPGVQSGIADVADVDKLAALSWVVSTGAKAKLIEPSREGIKSFLRGENPNIKLKNMGDDCLFWWSSEAVRDAFVKHTADAYFKTELDAIPTFLGNTVVTSGVRRTALPNVARGIANRLCPERGISRVMRQGVPRAFWAYGFKQGNEYYSQHPLFSECWETALDVLESFYNKPLRKSIEDAANRQEEEANRLYPQLSVYDQLFMLKPEVIKYRIRQELVNPQLLEHAYLTIPGEKVSLLESYFLK